MPAVVVLLFTALGPGTAPASPLSALERQHLIAYMKVTEGWLVEEVSGLSPAQLQFCAAPGTWSVAQVLEHLVVAEPVYWRNLHEAMNEAPPSRKTGTTDADILWYGIDRTQRQTATAAESPQNRLRDVQAGLDPLCKLHREMLRYARTTNDDLRSHVVKRQGCDAYQWLLMIFAHEQRHFLQIREIKADAKFPKR